MVTAPNLRALAGCFVGSGGMLRAPAPLPAAGVPVGGQSGAEHGRVLALAGRHRGHGITSVCQGSGRAAEDPGRGVCGFHPLLAGPGPWATSEQGRAASVGAKEIVLILFLFLNCVIW